MIPSSKQVRYDFEGQVVVVTGASGGIGRAIADGFVRQGATVVNWDRRPVENGDAPDAAYFEVDITDDASIRRATDLTVQQFGKIDGLVNNAGFAGSTQPLIESDPIEWQRVIDVNLVGTYRICRVVAPVMVQAGWGRIVNIASLAGKEGTPNASAYSAAKSGVIALTKSLGKELASTGVLVNGIAPAAVDTPLLAQMSPAHVQTMIDKSPMKRLGTVEEVAALVLWLSSAACSFSTGAIFDLSGGRSTY